MGAWIEIKLRTKNLRDTWSHPTMGAWIEISVPPLMLNVSISRTPRWVRGLKYAHINTAYRIYHVAPHDGCVD